MTRAARGTRRSWLSAPCANRPTHRGFGRAKVPFVTVNGTSAAPLDRDLIEEFRQIVGDNGVISRESELKVYECDGWTIEKSTPEVLLLPRSTEQVSAILRALDRRQIAFVDRKS